MTLVDDDDSTMRAANPHTFLLFYNLKTMLKRKATNLCAGKEEKVKRGHFVDSNKEDLSRCAII